jgi:5-formyltetrahydrofolate cyclo-ligase
MASAKDALRQQVLAQRRALPPVDRDRLSDAAQQRLAGLPLFQRARTLALYRPLRSEVDTARLATVAWEAGVRVCFPRLEPHARALTFVATTPDSTWARDPLGFEAPAEGEGVPLEELELVVLPGAAFDAHGHRLGLGKGYYDRTLAQRPAGLTTCGLAFAFQLVESVPVEPTDVAVDWVVTDQGAWPCSPG